MQRGRRYPADRCSDCVVAPGQVTEPYADEQLHFDSQPNQPGVDRNWGVDQLIYIFH